MQRRVSMEFIVNVKLTLTKAMRSVMNVIFFRRFSCRGK